MKDLNGRTAGLIRHLPSPSRSSLTHPPLCATHLSLAIHAANQGTAGAGKKAQEHDGRGQVACRVCIYVPSVCPSAHQRACVHETVRPLPASSRTPPFHSVHVTTHPLFSFFGGCRLFVTFLFLLPPGVAGRGRGAQRIPPVLLPPPPPPLCLSIPFLRCVLFSSKGDAQPMHRRLWRRRRHRRPHRHAEHSKTMSPDPLAQQ